MSADVTCRVGRTVFRLYTKESIEELGIDPARFEKIDDRDRVNLYIMPSDYTKEQVVGGSGEWIHTFDWAIPLDWTREPDVDRRLKTGDWAIWSYAKPFCIFGNPVWGSDMWRVIRNRLTEEIMYADTSGRYY